MNRVARRGTIGYEDLMRELEEFEQELLGEDRSMAMNLMVLEAKIRGRFQEMENRIWDRYSSFTEEPNAGDEEELTLAEIESMIPRDLSLFPAECQAGDGRRRNRAMQTIGLAAALAVLTAAGVFGLASVLQIIIGWLA